MNFMDQFLWVIYPYIALSVFILGLLVRYNTDQKGWKAKSSQLLERRLLKWGSLLFHIGIIFVFLGHVAGILVPLRVYRFMHVPDELYHINAALAGGTSGVITTIGIIILVYRRLIVRRIRLTSSISDMLAIILLVIVVINGMVVTTTHALDTSGFDYRQNIGPWFRGILTFRPNAVLMSGVPEVFKFHVFSAFLFFALIPFTRMVHIFSQPVTYLIRSFIVYRRRA